MAFIKNNYYLDINRNKYKFIEKAHGSNVLLFLDNNNIKVCRHFSGNYRWDEKDTDLDIKVG